MFALPNRDQVVAFAGLFQSAILVYQLANKSSHDTDALNYSGLSIIRVTSDSVIEIFGSIEAVALGYKTVDAVLSGKLANISRNIFGYAIAMHQVSQKLARSPHISDVVQQRLQELEHQHLFVSDGNRLADLEQIDQDLLFQQLAELYTSTISTLEPRIIVQGAEGRLTNPATVDKVRTALFAGIRAAYLWHQLGGRRWHLIMFRRTYQTISRRLMVV